MVTLQWLAAIGTGLGTLGSILTAFGLNGAVGELQFARNSLLGTVDALARRNRVVPIVTDHDRRIDRAKSRGNLLVGCGIVLLIVGLVTQVVAIAGGTAAQSGPTSPTETRTSPPK